MTLAFSALGLLVFLDLWESHMIVGLAQTSAGSFVLSMLLFHKPIPGQLSQVEPRGTASEAFSYPTENGRTPRQLGSPGHYTPSSSPK